MFSNLQNRLPKYLANIIYIYFHILHVRILPLYWTKVFLSFWAFAGDVKVTEEKHNVDENLLFYIQ